MKKYILKLIDDDIKLVEKQINFWERHDERVKQSDYQAKRGKALYTKLKRVKRYKERMEIYFHENVSY